MPNIGPIELIVVLVIALLILGPKRLPAAGRSLGQGLREFKDGISGQHSPTPVLEATPPTGASVAAAHETRPSRQPGESTGAQSASFP